MTQSSTMPRDDDPTPPAGGTADASALARLDEVCRSIAYGDSSKADTLFSLTVAADASDTVQRLAESFGFMLVQLEARELRLVDLIDDLRQAKDALEVANHKLTRENAELSGTVQRLSIEIDRRRLTQDVGAIVETDYFQTLQQRARAMRGRHRTGDK